MGEMMGNAQDKPEAQAAADLNPNVETPETGVKTDVEGVFADGEKNGVPVFKVTRDEFYQNMTAGRKRIRFKQGSNVQKYMSNTRYKRPFWIQNDDDGFVRKVK